MTTCGLTEKDALILSIVAARQRSCGKVLFLPLFVCPRGLPTKRGLPLPLEGGLPLGGGADPFGTDIWWWLLQWPIRILLERILVAFVIIIIIIF